VNDLLRITAYSASFGDGNETNVLTWSSKQSRCYQLDYKTSLNAGGSWVDATSVFAPDAGATTTRMLTWPPGAPSERYFRVEATKPLMP